MPLATPGVLESLSQEPRATAFLWPLPSTTVRPRGNDTLAFQYWPAQLTDDYQSNWAAMPIPGGSHPLYQWIGGAGRTISFEARFTAEANLTLEGLQGTAASHVLTPSNRFTANVAAAVAKIRQWQMPSYTGGQEPNAGLVRAPQRLQLAFPRTKLNGNVGDVLLVILRAGPVTYEAWFPNGEPRSATIPLQFNEVVQFPEAGGSNGGQGSRVKFVGRERFTKLAAKYQFKSSIAHPANLPGL